MEDSKLQHRRRGKDTGDNEDASTYSKSSAKVDSHRQASKGYAPSGAVVFVVIALVRCLSARGNLIHDCDEVYNHWEPLHYLLYGYGKQTWENSSEFALRPYLYVLIHAVFGAPAASVLGSEGGKAMTFYIVRGALGLWSALCEASLYCAVRDRIGAEAAVLAGLLLVSSTGMFAATTSMLPSTFTMTCITAATAATIQSNEHLVIASCAAGALVGWPFAALAMVPLCLRSLWRHPARALALAVLYAGVFLGPQAAIDSHFYGRPTLAQWNLVRYNVLGEGEGGSTLYGVEPPTFYLRNMANNFNFALPLALAFPVADVLASWGKGSGQGRASLYVVYGCVAVWVGAMSAAPHKEERFMYVVYPQIVLLAAATLARAPPAAAALLPLPRSMGRAVGRFAQLVLTALVVVLSVSRTWALLTNYGAPMRLLAALPSVEGGPPLHVCVGGEWHHFPSSFFLPGPSYRLAFVDSPFGGLLPADFEAAGGGTASAPPFLNSGNRKAPETLLQDASQCAYVMELRFGPEAEGAEVGSSLHSLSTGTSMMVAAVEPFLDAPASPALTRAFYIPTVSPKKNKFGNFVLLQKSN